MAQERLTAGATISLASLNYPDRSVRHRNFLGEITPIRTELDREDATFRVLPGLAGRGTVSLESINYPGHYLRHQDFRLRLQRLSTEADKDLFRRDASFRVTAGLADSRGISLESLNFPDHFIRHRNFHLYLDKNDDSRLFREDATFLVRQPFRLPAWTILVYLDADNNLEPYGLRDFEEMARVGSSADLNIVVQMDRHPDYTAEAGDWDGTRRFLVIRDESPDTVPLAILGEQNMASTETLRDFVEWGVRQYRARHYLLVIWNHGTGWRAIPERALQGRVPGAPGRQNGPGAVAVDETDNDILYMREVQDGLEQAADNLAVHGRPFRLDVIGFDACLMGMVEVAYAVRNVADIMVASEYCEPASGWPYDTILEALTGQPAMMPEAVGAMIVDRYHASHGGSDSWGITMSALDMAGLPAVVAAIDRFTAVATRRWARLRKARAASQLYHTINGGDCCDKSSTCWGVDLRHFADQVRKRLSSRTRIHHAATELDRALDAMVLRERHSDQLPGSSGLAIYFPPHRRMFDQDPDSDGYSQDNTFMPVDFVRDHRWDEWLDLFYNNETEEDYNCAMDSDCLPGKRCCEPRPPGPGTCIPAGASCP